MNPEVTAKLAVDVLLVYLANNAVPPAQLPDLVSRLKQALAGGDPIDQFAPPALEPDTSLEIRGLQPPKESQSQLDEGAPQVSRAAVPIEESIHDEFLISLEDGKRYRSLKRHLMAKYGMTPDNYRQKWGLPSDYPMVAPSYARDRSAIARRIGLGQASNLAAPPRAGVPRNAPDRPKSAVGPRRRPSV